MSNKYSVNDPPLPHQKKQYLRTASPNVARLTTFFTCRKLEPLWKHGLNQRILKYQSSNVTTTVKHSQDSAEGITHFFLLASMEHWGWPWYGTYVSLFFRSPIISSTWSQAQLSSSPLTRGDSLSPVSVHKHKYTGCSMLGYFNPGERGQNTEIGLKND